MSKFEGSLDLATGMVTDLATGRVFTQRQWRRYCTTQTIAEHRRACAARDTTSDIQNLPGSKPEFRDDWMGIVPEQKPRVPR